MFVQLIQANVDDVDAVRAQLERWVSDLAPDADGWLGTTAGVTADGRLVALARFESEAAADKNSSRPEQGEWWSALEPHLGSPTFRNSTHADAWTQGDPDRAGFVQVMTGTVTDLDRARKIMIGVAPVAQSSRSDILGQLLCGFPGGEWAMAIYFSSEEAARRGEQQDPPAELAEAMSELDSLSSGETAYADLTSPWLHSNEPRA